MTTYHDDYARTAAHLAELTMLAAHRPTFDAPGHDLPICLWCKVEITGEMWVRQERCPEGP